jgi:xanthine/CO dehydrogenase XdhC/CoxF family maturation factor
MVQLCSGQATLVPNTMPCAQRAALVRAAVQQREHLVLVVAEHRDVHALRARDAA